VQKPMALNLPCSIVRDVVQNAVMLRRRFAPLLTLRNFCVTSTVVLKAKGKTAKISLHMHFVLVTVSLC
jgi:hypothetical protein